MFRIRSAWKTCELEVKRKRNESKRNFNANHISKSSVGKSVRSNISLYKCLFLHSVTKILHKKNITVKMHISNFRMKINCQFSSSFLFLMSAQHLPNTCVHSFSLCSLPFVHFHIRKPNSIKLKKVWWEKRRGKQRIF